MPNTTKQEWKNMLSSNVEEMKLTVSDQFKKFGYSAIALALKQLIHNGQRKLAAMIIIALCLAPRKSGVENSGVRRILRSISLWRLAKADMEFMCELQREAGQCANPNKAMISLVATGWMESHNYWPNNINPWMLSNDGCIYLNWRDWAEGSFKDFQHMLCDHAGCQHQEHFSHFRMIWDNYSNWGVRVIGRQLDRDRKALKFTAALPNGYYEYMVPAETVLFGFGDKDGRTLADLLKPGVWYNHNFEPDTELDLVDHVKQEMADARQRIANTIMKFGAFNG